MINIESLTLKELDELSKAIHVEKSNKLDAIDKKIEEFGKEWVKKILPILILLPFLYVTVFM